MVPILAGDDMGGGGGRRGGVFVEVSVGVIVGDGGVVAEAGDGGGGGVYVEVGVGVLVGGGSCRVVVGGGGCRVVVEGGGGRVGIDVHGRLVHGGADSPSLGRRGGRTPVVDIWRWW